MHSYQQLDPEIRKTLEEQETARAAENFRKLQQALADAEYQSPQPENPLGPTGRFPEGKLTPADQGEIRYQIGIVKGKVALNFGSPVQAIGLSPDQALHLADLLRQYAKKLRPDRKRNHGGKK